MTLVRQMQACIEATTQDEADRCFAVLVTGLHLARVGWTREEVEAHARANLGYWIGYAPKERRAELEAFYRCVHPIFGPVAECGFPTSEEAFAVGLAMARAKGRDERERIIADFQAERRRLHALEKAGAA